MHKGNDVPIQKSIRKQNPVVPAAIAKRSGANYLEIQPGDSPAIVRLKKLGMIDSTELEQFAEEMKAEKKR